MAKDLQTSTRFSNRSLVAADGPSEYSQRVESARRAGRISHDLTGSNPTQADLPYADSGVFELWAATSAQGYVPESQGLESARHALCELWSTRGHDVEPERLLMTASTSEAYSLLFKLLCDPGASVLVPRPAYPLLEHLAAFDGVELRPYDIRWDGAWHIDRGSVEAAVSANTQAVVLVSPNNPTGSTTSSEELRFMAGLGLPLISDEVFGTYSLTAEPHESALSVADETLTFVLDGLSKRIGLPQLKLGWITIAGPQPLARVACERLVIMNDAYLSAGTPVQRALPGLLKHGERIHKAIHQRLKHNLTELQKQARGSALTVFTPQAGWSVCLQLPATWSEDEWLDRLLEAGVLLQPGWLFDFEREPMVVASLLTPRGRWAAGIAQLLESVAAG